MSEFEVWVPVEIDRSREVVWHALTSTEEFVKWWWGTDELVAVEPGFEAEATLQFSSGWSAKIDEFVPLDTLAFGGNRFKLSDVGDGLTKLEWSQWVQGDPSLDQLMGIDSARPFRQRMVVALDRFKKLVETERVLVQVSAERASDPVEDVLVADMEQEARHVRIFVSSTFADMTADRNELAQKSFLELRQFCRDRGVIFSEVDLRWGITDEQQAEGQVLPICLAEIDRCRPYFIGLLGERYGSVLKDIPEELVDQQPWLADHRQSSVTELEILHGVLNNPEMAENAFFYFRDPDYIDAQPEQQRSLFREGPTDEEIAVLGPDEAERRAADRQRGLRDLKEIVRERFDVRTYRNPQQLAAFVVEDLTAIIDQRFPVGSAPTLDQREEIRQAGFAAELRSVFIDRPELIAALDNYVNDTGPPLVVHGEPGSGKSSLLANWITHRQIHDSETLLLSHFVAASARSSEPRMMFRLLLKRLALKHGLSIDIPDDIEALKRTFASALLTASKSGRLIVVVDGADGVAGQNPEGPLTWVPHHLPPEVRLIVSTSPGHTLDGALRRSWKTLEVPALDSEERKRLIAAYLDRFAKSLSDEHMAHIAAHQHSSTPQFLTVLLDELRWKGNYATLGSTIDGYLVVEDIAELYGKVLERCEENYSQDQTGLVEDALCVLWAAREGLTENELMELLGDGNARLPHALWSPFALAADAVIMNRSGLICLRNHHVRCAVESRYLNSAERRREVYLRLATFFSNSDRSRRRATELPWLLARAGEWAELYDVLSDEQVLVDIWNEEPWDLRHYWAEISRNTSRSMDDGYRAIIEHPDQHHVTAGLVAQLLVQGGFLNEALPLAQYLVNRARRDRDAGRLVVALNNLSPILAAQGDLDARLECARELEGVARDIGDKMGIAGALANRAGVYVVRGKFEKAIGLYREEEQLRRKLGDRDGLQYCIGNQAQILVDRADLDTAMELRRKQERLSREVGNLHGLRIALGTQAVIHRMQGNFETAIRLHHEEEELCRETGDKLGLQVSLGNQALIIQAGGDLDTAITLFRDQEQLCRELGVLQDLATSLNNQAGILMQWGDLDGAERLYQEQEQICRELGYELGLQASLGNQGLLRMHLGDVGGAVELYRKQEEICRRCGFPVFLAHCLNNLVMPLRMLDQHEEADSVGSEALELVERYGLNARH